MNDQPTAPRVEIPRPKRGEGQWGLGYLEPLNKNEQSKRDNNPLNAIGRIRGTWAHTEFDRIDPADKRGRFRWAGLYTQRAPGFDGGKTATLEEEELDDEFFMMRVRTDGQILTGNALRTLGELSNEYCRGTADITDRNNIQYHWVEIASVPDMWDRLDAVGLTTIEACGDSPRPFLGSPVAGIAKDELIDGSSALAEIKRRALGNPDFSNFPRKFKTALTGHPSHDVAPEVNDIAFVATVHPEHGVGFDCWVGGGLSTNPHLAQKLGVWIPLEEVPDVWEAVAGIFRDFGYRRLRSRARLKFLVADWGIEKFREVMEVKYLQREMIRCESPAVPTHQGDHIGIHEQKDGKFFIGAAPVVGRINGDMLVALADLVDQYGAAGARLTAYQKLVVIGVDGKDTAAFAEGLEKIGLTSSPSNWRRRTMACTGIEYCKLAIVETKDRAAQLITELEKRFPELDTPISINLNGCPNACARTQVADIGLKGQLVLDENGDQVSGYQVHLGGGLALGANFGRKLRAHKVTAAGLDDYVTTVVTNYLEGRETGESFQTWVQRADEGLLR